MMIIMLNAYKYDEKEVDDNEDHYYDGDDEDDYDNEDHDYDDEHHIDDHYHCGDYEKIIVIMIIK